MKDKFFGYLAVPDDETEEKLSEYLPKNDKTAQRILTESKRRYAMKKSHDISSENTGTSAVKILPQKHQRRRLILAAAGAAACVLASFAAVSYINMCIDDESVYSPVKSNVSDTSAAVSDHTSVQSEDRPQTAETQTSEDFTTYTSVADDFVYPEDIRTDSPHETVCPFGDLTNERVCFMQAPYAPCLMKITEEQQAELAKVLNDAEWTLLPDTDYTPQYEGEYISMYVYNGGDPYRLNFFGTIVRRDNTDGSHNVYSVSQEVSGAAYHALDDYHRYDIELKDLIFFEPADNENYITDVWKAVDRYEKTTPPRDPAKDTDTKDGIFNAMINSIDHYDKASGSIIFSFSEDDPHNAEIVEFRTDLDNARAYSRSYRVYLKNEPEDISGTTKGFPQPPEYDGITSETIMRCGNGVMTKIFVDRNETEQTEDVIYRENAGSFKAWNERTGIGNDGYPYYEYRADPTNVPLASRCLFSQGLAFSFLTDLDTWEIDHEEIYKARECVVIKGTQHTRHHIDHFIFFVDKLNGTLLKYEGFNADGEIVEYLFTIDIAFDGAADDVEYENISGD